MSGSDKITLVDVLINQRISNTNSQTYSDMSAFYLSERKGAEHEQAPGREYYFHHRHRAEDVGVAVNVIAPGFNSEWDCIGTLIPNNPESFSLEPVRLNSVGVSDFFPCPMFGIRYEGLTRACKRYFDSYPSLRQPCHFVDAKNLYSLGEDVSKFVRRLMNEIPDQKDEADMRKMLNYLIMSQLIYALDMSVIPGSAPWFTSMSDR